MDTLMGASPSHEAEADPQSAIYGNIKLSKLPSPDVAEYDSDLHFVVDCALILHLCVRDAFYKALGPATHKQAESDLYTSITKMDIGRKVPCCFACDPIPLGVIPILDAAPVLVVPPPCQKFSPFRRATLRSAVTLGNRKVEDLLATWSSCEVSWSRRLRQQGRDQSNLRGCSSSGCSEGHRKGAVFAQDDEYSVPGCCCHRSGVGGESDHWRLSQENRRKGGL